MLLVDSEGGEGGGGGGGGAVHVSACVCACGQRRWREKDAAMCERDNFLFGFSSVSLFSFLFFFSFPAFRPSYSILIWLPWQQSSSNQNISTSFHLAPPLCRASSVYINFGGDETSQSLGLDLVRLFFKKRMDEVADAAGRLIYFLLFYFFYFNCHLCVAAERGRGRLMLGNKWA